MNGDILPRLPRVAFLTGLVLLMVTSGILGGIYLSVDPSVFIRKGETGFFNLLRDYDYKSKMILDAGLAHYTLNDLDYDLVRLEKGASGVESWLSVLKRRRALAGLDSRFAQAYEQSVRKASDAFPYSEQIAVIKAAFLVRNAALTEETTAELRGILPQLASPRFAPALLSFHILLGDFRNPERAAALLPPALIQGAFTQTLFSGVPAEETEAVITDLVLVQILSGDIREATAAVQSHLSAEPSPEFSRFAAEYFYDFGDLLRSAQLFSGFPDEAALGRQADALWLAGRADVARNLWAMLATGPLQNRSLYNLAVTAETRDESERLLKRLTDASFFSEIDVDAATGHLYGLIRYSRLLPAPQAVEVLESGKTADTLIDMEILRRRAETREPARTVAETWMILDRKPSAGELYEWGAWYFGFQRYFSEIDILLTNAARNNISGQWIDIHKGLKRLREGDTEGAEEILVSVDDNLNWTVAANLGRIREAHRAPERALASYRRALETLTDPAGGRQIADEVRRHRLETASRIQVNIARVLKTQGKILESREALEYAVELNPDNLTARLELSKLGIRN